MASEIEHKYLVLIEKWAPSDSGVLYRQGYLSSVKERVVRVRAADEKGFLTIKGLTTGVTRSEYEYEIPVADATSFLNELCERPLIEKKRYRQLFAGHTWEIDQFFGENEGLVVAEIELKRAVEPFETPPWVGEEVSSDPRYFNSNLVLAPYRTWKK